MLLPLAIIVALVFVAMGLPQTLDASVTATTVEGAQQTIALGPVASQEAIKQLGTNGGGFFNVNAAHPFENPTAFSNYLNIVAMLSVSAALVYAFGQMVGDRRQGWAFLAVTGILLIAGVGAIYWAETYGNPILTGLGVDPSLGNMEGKEVRFGQAMTAAYAAVTTGLSDGGVNGMHGSFTGLGGLVPMFLIQLGEVLPGGVGSGLYGMLVFAILTVFVAGLMVGRTPELLGKKIESREMKYAMLAVLILPLAILGFTAVSAMLPFAVKSVGTGGPHGLSEILYAYTSAAGNNGSAFGGLSANTPWYNTTLGIAMLLGRFAYAVPVLAIAGSLVGKTRVPASAGTFPTHTPLFVGLLIGIILILGGLQFFPALALGPDRRALRDAGRPNASKDQSHVQTSRNGAQPVRPGHSGAGDPPGLPETRPAPADAQSGDLRHRNCRRRRDAAVREGHRNGNGDALFSGQIAVWLWFTVLFATFAEAVAEGRGKAQADSLRRTKSQLTARKLVKPDGLDVVEVPAADLKVGDLVIVEAGELIPGDGEVVKGVASVNESAITGKSAPVIRESGGDRSAVTGGTQVLSDWLEIRITVAPGASFVDRMIALIEGAERQKTPNEIALSILLSGLTLIFLIAVVTLWGLAGYSQTVLTVTVLGGVAGDAHPHHDRRAAVGHRHCRHGPAGALQCDCHLGPCGRGGGRCRYAACSTRPARLPSATAWPAISCRSRACRRANWRRRRCSPAWRTKRRKAAPS